MKRFISILFCLMAVFMLVGCEEGGPFSISFMDITGAGSTDNTFVAKLSEEKSFKDKYCDLCIESEIEGLSLSVAKENGDFVTIVVPQKDVWYSLTALISAGKGESGQETYQKYKETQSLTYIIRSGVETTLKVKGVVGNIEENADGGDLLSNRTDASKEFEFKLKKYEK